MSGPEHVSELQRNRKKIDIMLVDKVLHCTLMVVQPFFLESRNRHFSKLTTYG